MIEFDIFPRDLKVTERYHSFAVTPFASPRVELAAPRNVLFSTKGDVLELQRLTAIVDIEASLVIADCREEAPQIISLSQPLPLTFQVLNSPAPHLQPDGSYEYLPEVSGGVGAYQFILDGELSGNFTFDSKTGSLRRPPQ